MLNFILLIGPTIAALLTWALSKVYSLTHEKISIGKDLISIRSNSLDAKHAADRAENKTSELINLIKETNERAEKDRKVLFGLLEEIKNLKTENKEHKKMLGTYGKVIKVLVEDWEKRKK